MEGAAKCSPAAAVPVNTKIPDPMMAPIPSAVKDHGPRVLRRRFSGRSDSEISLSIDLQQRSWFDEPPGGPASTGGCVVVGGCAKSASLFPGNRSGHRIYPCPGSKSYRFAWPRASFFTLRFCEPRGYSRAFNGFSVLRFLREARLDFFRSSLLSVFVFAMSAE